VTNTISGGYQYGPVLQGRDFIGLTFGATPAPPAGPKDPDADLALAGVRRFEEAISAHQDAAAIFREIGDLARLLPAFRRQTTHAAPNAMKPAQV
jgi:hypothetical protein